jgi:cellulose synthase/poly-beta-1,6-N-acetylglucosamine synthase-like glycosyltransferase
MLIFALISLLLIIPYGMLIAYYHSAWKAIPIYSPATPGSPSPHTRISVLVPARNEAVNIGACLDSLVAQSYSRALYEVIVIDDHSTDRTWEILAARPDTDMHFRAMRLADAQPVPERVKAHKKFAIEVGVGVATGELIITTDADCRFHPDWLRTMAGFYEDTGAKFIAAPVKIAAANSFLSIFQTLDFITLQGITGAAVYKNFHSMCNGANLAYTKEAFFAVDGFRDIDQIPSGDDMLLMHKVFKKYPGKLFFLKNREAIVSTKEETSWRGFINQRVRWASKADHYQDRLIFWALLLVYLVNLDFLCLLVAACWNIGYLWIFFALLIGKILIEFAFVRSSALFFGQQRLMAWFPLMQPLHILYTVAVGWLGKFGSYSWKDRRSV